MNFLNTFVFETLPLCDSMHGKPGTITPSSLIRNDLKERYPSNTARQPKRATPIISFTHANSRRLQIFIQLFLLSAL